MDIRLLVNTTELGQGIGHFKLFLSVVNSWAVWIFGVPVFRSTYIGYLFRSTCPWWHFSAICSASYAVFIRALGIIYTSTVNERHMMWTEYK